MPTFATEWKSYSPGRLLLEYLIQWSIEQRLKVFDFTVGDEEYKKEWTRFTYINTALWDDYYTLEDRYIALEQEENKKKYKKPKQIVKKRKN